MPPPRLTHLSMVDHTITGWFQDDSTAGTHLLVEPVVDGLTLMGVVLTQAREGARVVARRSVAEKRAKRPPWGQFSQQMNTLIGLTPFRMTPCSTVPSLTPGAVAWRWDVVLPHQGERVPYVPPGAAAAGLKLPDTLAGDAIILDRKPAPDGAAVMAMMKRTLSTAAAFNDLVDELGLGEYVRLSRKGHVLIRGGY